MNMPASAAMQWEPWMGWRLQQECARHHRDVTTRSAALHQPTNTVEPNSAPGYKVFVDSKRQRFHLSLETLLPDVCSSEDEGPSHECIYTPETRTPPLSPASSGRTTPLSLSPPPGLQSLAKGSCASVLPLDTYLGLDVTSVPCSSPPVELSLDASLSRLPSSLPLLSAIQVPLVGFRPPPGLPPPPGFVVPSSVPLAQRVFTTEEKISVDDTNSMPQTEVVLSNACEPAVPVNSARHRPLATSEHTGSGLSVHYCIVDGAARIEVEWRLQDPMRKLRVSCGFPIVSPEFAIGEGRSLRLAFTAGQKWGVECNSTSAKHKKKPAKTEQLPLNGSLQLKALGDFSLSTLASRVSFSLGGLQQGQLELAERTVQSIDLVTDWRGQLEGDDGRELRVHAFFSGLISVKSD